MRWSWPAFAAGVAVGLLVAIPFLVERSEPALELAHGAAATPAAPAGTLTGLAPVALLPPPAHEPRHRADAGTSQSPPGAATETAEPDDRPEPPAPAEAAGDGAVPHAQTLTFDVATGTVRGAVIRLEGGVLTIEDRRDHANPMATQGLDRARRRADAAISRGESTSPDHLDALLASDSDDDRETAVGLAAKPDVARVDALLKVVKNASFGSLRPAAMLALAAFAEDRPDVVTALLALTEDADVDVRRTAIDLLPTFGVRAGDRALAILRSGDYEAASVTPLTRAVAASGRALEFLLGRPEASLAFAVGAPALAADADPDARARLLARLPDLVRPYLLTPEMTVNADLVCAALAEGGHGDTLRAYATSPTTPTAVRLAAVNAALQRGEVAASASGTAAAVLSDGATPVDLLRATIQAVPDALRADAGVRRALEDLAASHSSPWVREEARARLQGTVTAPDRDLVIVSGIYGLDGKSVDVTRALAALVVRGRLVVEAGNHLAGDPNFGIVKELTVVYVWKGERRSRSISEYETLVLP